MLKLNQLVRANIKRANIELVSVLVEVAFPFGPFPRPFLFADIFK